MNSPFWDGWLHTNLVPMDDMTQNHPNLNLTLSLTNLIYQHNSDDRREEKLYVEGMEDEDMKKETQNLAYPPAFKVPTLRLVRFPD